MKKVKESEEIFELIYTNSKKIKTELNYSTPFQFLIAVIMSAQTTDKQVNIATKDFFEKVKIPEDLVTWKLEDIEKYFKSLNYYKTKSKSILATAKLLTKDYKSIIPNSLEEIQKLPGVGIKTAKVVLGVLYDAPYIGVDTHVHRICNRIGICTTKTPEETDKFLEINISTETKRKVHHALVLFGRYTCTARNPKCESCFLNNTCEYYKSLKSI
ncbi:MAG: endonuclease III [Candidatus Gracilibacteria bacterium]|nr:endonuclease III [Candidatus Gracilibacteria bacterium]MDD2908271.1 endonuclease III [Candidatus Gracilibacteria bacterium]